MNFIQQAYKGRNEWWKYLVTFLIVIFGWQLIGSIPLLVAAVMHSKDTAEFTKAAENAFMGLGINSSLYLFLLILTFAFGLLSLLISVKYIHKRSITSLVTSREKIDWGRFWVGFATWGMIALIMIVIGILMAPENYTWNFKPVPFFTLVAVALLFLPLQTSFEELLFRGYMMQEVGVSSTKKYFPLVSFLTLIYVLSLVYLLNVLDVSGLLIFLFTIAYILVFGLLILFGAFDGFVKSGFNNSLINFLGRKSTPLILTSVVFGLMHGANPEIDKLGWIAMVFYIGTGFFYGICTLMDEGTELALGLHAVNNIIAAILVTTDWTVFQTDALYVDTSEPSVGWEMFLPVFVLYPIMLWLFGRKYGWKNWIEKLTGKIEKPAVVESSQFS